jgi:hypothetical protein
MTKATWIDNPVVSGDFPFSLDQQKKWKYGCTACRFVTDDIGAIQQHLYTKHPLPKRKHVQSKPKDRIVKPNAEQRKDIRAAIAESKQRHL